MRLPENYLTDSKIKSLSSRLETVAKDPHSSRFYVDSSIKSENLKFNLTSLLSNIILKVQLSKREKEDFMQIIELYNSENKTEVQYHDFTAINWIVEVNQEIVIPELLRTSIFRKSYAKEEGKTTTPSPDLQHFIAILELYHERFYKERKLLISTKELNEILKKAHESINMQFLLEKGIIARTENPKSYQWKDSNQYVRHLGTEIGATLWAEFGGEAAEYESFRQYYTLIRAVGIWPTDLKNFLTRNSCSNLVKLAVKYLYDQQDLAQSASEFRKIWLNASDYYDRGITAEIPSIKFNYSDTFTFINSVKWAERQFPDIFDYQSSRNYFLLLLNVIIENEPDHPRPHQSILKLLEELNFPIVVWNIYERIPKHYPELIPSLLSDTNLVPLAFRLIDKININENYPAEDSDEQKYRLNSEEINAYWMEMFAIFLDKAEAINYEKEKMGIVLARILGDLALKIFTSEGQTRNNWRDHLKYRKRYDTVIKKLSVLRLSNSFSGKDAVNPRIIFHFLPSMTKYVMEQLSVNDVPYNGYLRINSSWTDLGIEILKLLNLRTSEAEIGRELSRVLQDSGSSLTLAIRDYLVYYYTVEEFDTKNFYGQEAARLNASRTDREFGIEIIDWGYLITCMERESILEGINDTIIGSLNFLKKGDKYDKQNIEQATKLKLYTKSLLLAFLAISEKKNEYEIDGLPAVSALQKLEKWIMQYALRYSVEDISNSRTDIFNELYNSFGYHQYHNHLSDLLYRSVPYFKTDTQEKFVADYVTQNNDISRLLAALNIIEQKNLQDIISERINQIDVAQYISSKFMITDLENALREAIVSDNHWQLAEQFLLKIQNHYNKRKDTYQNAEDFLFEINLLLAFRQNNFDKLNSMLVPEKKYRIEGENKKGRYLKSYFIALFYIYNDKTYDKAIRLLHKLQADDPKNIRYAFQLYRAQTLKAIES